LIKCKKIAIVKLPDFIRMLLRRPLCGSLLLVCGLAAALAHRPVDQAMGIGQAEITALLVIAAAGLLSK
jgi:hypothetical protein